MTQEESRRYPNVPATWLEKLAADPVADPAGFTLEFQSAPWIAEYQAIGPVSAENFQSIVVAGHYLATGQPGERGLSQVIAEGVAHQNLTVKGGPARVGRLDLMRRRATIAESVTLVRGVQTRGTPMGHERREVPIPPAASSMTWPRTSPAASPGRWCSPR